MEFQEPYYFLGASERLLSLNVFERTLKSSQSVESASCCHVNVKQKLVDVPESLSGMFANNVRLVFFKAIRLQLLSFTSIGRKRSFLRSGS